MTDPGLGRTVLELTTDTTKFYPDLDKAKKEALGFGGVFGPIRQNLKGFGDDSVKVGKVLTASLSLPLALAGGTAIKFALDFNKAMANVATLIPGNTARVTELKVAVQDMAVATGQSTDDLAGGLYQVISAFGDTADTAKILEINAKAAAAGVATTTDAINLTSAVTKGYGDTSAEAVQKVSDLAFQAVKLGQTTFPELASSIGRVTPLAAELGVAQEELFGVMATFTGVTGGAAEVSTQLRGVLQALLSPTDKMKGLFKELGVESGTALIQQRGLKGAMQAIVDAAKSGGRDLKDYVGSIEGQTLALSAAGAQSDTFTQKLGEMTTAAGASEQAFQDQTEGVNKTGFQWQQFKQAAIVAAQKLGDELLPIISDIGTQLKPMVEWLLKGVGHFKDLPEPVKKATVALGALLVIAGPLAIGLGKVALALDILTASKSLAILSGLGPKLLALGGGVAGLGATIGAAYTAAAMKAVTAGRSVVEIETDIATVLGRSGGIVDQRRQGLLRFAETVNVVAQGVRQLTQAEIEEARELHERGASIAQIADHYKVTEEVARTAIQGTARATGDLTEALRQAQAEVAALTTAQRANIEAGLKLGLSNEEIATRVHVSAGALDLFKNKLTAAGKAATAAEGPLKAVHDRVAELTTVWRAYEELGTGGTAMRTEWIDENADAILKATRNATALGVELPLAFQRAGQAAAAFKVDRLFKDMGEQTHALAVQWQQDTEQAARAQLVAINENVWKAYGIQKDYQDKLSDLSLSGTALKLTQITREHDAMVAAAKAQTDTTQESIDRQLAAYDAYYGLLERMAEGSADTIVEQMREAGVVTRKVLTEIADQEKKRYEQMLAYNTRVAPAFQFTADALAAQADKVRQAQQAAAGVTIAWGQTLQALSGAFSELSQVSGGTFGGIVKGVGTVISSLNLIDQGWKTFQTGTAAMETAVGATAKLAAGMTMATGAITMATAALNIMLSAYAYFKTKEAQQIAEFKGSLAAWSAFLQGYNTADAASFAALKRQVDLTGQSWDRWAAHIASLRGDVEATQHAIDELRQSLMLMEKAQAAANSAIDLTGEMVAAWVKPIREAREGLTDAQKAYDDLAADPDADPLELEEAGKKVDEFRAKLLKLGPDAQEAFESLEAYAVGAFAAAFKTTGDFYGSLQSMGPVLDDLSEGQEALGLSGSDAINELLGIRDVQRQYSALLTPLNTATRAVQALDAAGIHSDAAYQALGRDAKKTYDTMIAGGVDATTAQALMQPTLQTLWGLWKDGKVAVDDETAAILRQAEEHGIVGVDQKSINDQMLVAFQKLKDAIDLMTTAIQNFGTDAEAAYSRARDGAIAYGKAVPRETPVIPEPSGGTVPGAGGTAAPRTPLVPPDIFHQGGIVRPRPIGASLWRAGESWARAHTGMLVGETALRASDRPIIAEVGEGLLSRDVGMPALGRWALAAMNQGEGPRSDRTNPPASAPPASVNVYAITAMDGTDVERVLIRHGAASLTKSVTMNAFHANHQLKAALKALLDL